ncbi:12707_t:CDS:2, partial [Acaulospora colombiana]
IVGRDVQLLSSYDYIIVGAGASGLTVANRLTENPWVKVLVIEAGDLDAGEDEILVPRYALGAPAKYFYSIPSVPQPGLNNRSEVLLAGKVVGGGTAVNGMFMPRGAKADYDIWEDLGNSGWGWNDLLPYFIKSETFTPPPAALAQEFGITYDMRYHELFLKAIQQFGSHVPYDYASGDALGAYWAPNTLDPVSRTRSYARTAYYEPAKSRQNLHLLPGNTVTQIIFDGKAATGVKSVSACKEIILAAGAPHTPQILQLSGVGPKNLLNSFGIPVVSDLPGVGANFHDHPYLFTAGTVANDLNPSPANNSNTTWMAEQLELYKTKREGVYTTSLGNSAAFLPLHEITTLSNTIINKLQNQNVANFFPSGTDSSIINGFKAERDLFVKYLKQGKIAVGEFIGGTGAGMGLVLLKPFSRGFLTLKSKDAFDDPVVDFATLRNPLDLDIITEMIKAWRRMLQTPALQTMGPTATSPPDSVTSDADIQSFIRTNLASSLWHPSGSAPMMKKNLGGVVGPDLLVYGTKRLSIIDASIIPVCPSTHITSTMYALAEK